MGNCCGRYNFENNNEENIEVSAFKNQSFDKKMNIPLDDKVSFIEN